MRPPARRISCCRSCRRNSQLPGCFARDGDQPLFGRLRRLDPDPADRLHVSGDRDVAFGMKDSPRGGPAELRQQDVKSLNSLRVSNFKFIIALYLIILSLLTIVLHTGFNPTLRPLVDLLWIVGGVSLFLRSQTTHHPSRPL